MASTVAVALRSNNSLVLKYVKELLEDSTLRDHIANATKTSRDRVITDAYPNYGRRALWYACVRILRPSVVFETGIDKGLGSCILASALLKNGAEGFPGRYFGTDINPAAGFLLSRPYAGVGSVLLGDSIESIGSFDSPIDLFINDSDHSAEYEAGEYAAVQRKLSEGAIIIGDNCAITDMLYNFSVRTGRSFLFTSEDPVDHPTCGSGIGIVF